MNQERDRWEFMRQNTVRSRVKITESQDGHPHFGYTESSRGLGRRHGEIEFYNSGQLVVRLDNGYYVVPTKSAVHQVLKYYASTLRKCKSGKDEDCASVRQIFARYDPDGQYLASLPPETNPNVPPVPPPPPAGGTAVPGPQQAGGSGEHGTGTDGRPTSPEANRFAEEERFFNGIEPIKKEDSAKFIRRFTEEFGGQNMGNGAREQGMLCLTRNLLEHEPTKAFNLDHVGYAILKEDPSTHKYRFIAGVGWRNTEKKPIKDDEGVELEFTKLNDATKEGVAGFLRPPKGKVDPCADPFFPNIHPKMFEFKLAHAGDKDHPPEYMFHYQVPGQGDAYCRLTDTRNSPGKIF